MPDERKSTSVTMSDWDWAQLLKQLEGDCRFVDADRQNLKVWWENIATQVYGTPCHLNFSEPPQTPVVSPGPEVIKHPWWKFWS